MYEDERRQRSSSPTSVEHFGRDLLSDGVRKTRLFTLSPRKNVSWSTPLVTEVRTRPRTLPQDVPDLFYSSAETDAFRRESRREEDTERSVGPIVGRVVVAHKGAVKEYSSLSPTDDCFDHPDFWNGAITWFKK